MEREELFVTDKDLDALAHEVVAAALSRRVRITSAESCTGGMVASYITCVDGSSAVFDGTVVSYANRIKHNLLGVSNETLETVGAVSPQTAAQMARGVQELMGADIAVSITGIAGPSGGSELKPVGTVWFGLADKDGVTTEMHLFAGERNEVRRASAYTALSLLKRALLD